VRRGERARGGEEGEQGELEQGLMDGGGEGLGGLGGVGGGGGVFKRKAVNEVVVGRRVLYHVHITKDCVFVCGVGTAVQDVRI
jgi:hypothetical protein